VMGQNPVKRHQTWKFLAYFSQSDPQGHVRVRTWGSESTFGGSISIATVLWSKQDTENWFFKWRAYFLNKGHARQNGFEPLSKLQTLIAAKMPFWNLFTLTEFHGLQLWKNMEFWASKSGISPFPNKYLNNIYEKSSLQIFNVLKSGPNRPIFFNETAWFN